MIPLGHRTPEQLLYSFGSAIYYAIHYMEGVANKMMIKVDHNKRTGTFSDS